MANRLLGRTRRCRRRGPIEPTRRRSREGVTTIDLAAAPEDLRASGLLHNDDARLGASSIRLVAETGVVRRGRGPITIEWDADGVAVKGGELIWLVTTNKGWAHLRGVAWASDLGPHMPFRADLFSATVAGDPGPDRLALRFYAVGADPNVASPLHKVHGWLEPGSIRLARRS